VATKATVTSVRPISKGQILANCYAALTSRNFSSLSLCEKPYLHSLLLIKGLPFLSGGDFYDVTEIKPNRRVNP
jgi:hypothetical protein